MGNGDAVAEPRRNKLVLVVDDEHHIRTVVAAKLRASSFGVVEAKDGEEALALAVETLPDAVVTDLNMPVMSGLELCRALRADTRTSTIPAIILTARGYILDDELLSGTSIKRVMSKPFSAKAVVEHVRALLGVEAVHPASGTSGLEAA